MSKRKVLKKSKSRLCGIYSITNNLNGKVYVGQSVHIFSRWSAHLCSKNKSAISSALLKYGAENFSFRVLKLCLKSQLDMLEVSWIASLNCVAPHGYNLDSGGNSKKTLTETTKNILRQKVREYARVNGKEATDTEVWNFEHVDGRSVTCSKWDLRRLHIPEYLEGAWCDLDRLVEGKALILFGWFMSERRQIVQSRWPGLFKAWYKHKDGREVFASEAEMRLTYQTNSSLNKLRLGTSKTCKGWYLLEKAEA
jgi:hypothetical protein